MANDSFFASGLVRLRPAEPNRVLGAPARRRVRVADTALAPLPPPPKTHVHTLAPCPPPTPPRSLPRLQLQPHRQHLRHLPRMRNDDIHWSDSLMSFLRCVFRFFLLRLSLAALLCAISCTRAIEPPSANRTLSSPTPARVILLADRSATGTAEAVTTVLRSLQTDLERQGYQVTQDSLQTAAPQTIPRQSRGFY